MATVPDKSGNSPIGMGVDPHIPTPDEVSGEATDAKLDAIQTELEAQTAILADIETNTQPTP